MRVAASELKAGDKIMTPVDGIDRTSRTVTVTSVDRPRFGAVSVGYDGGASCGRMILGAGFLIDVVSSRENTVV